MNLRNIVTSISLAPDVSFVVFYASKQDRDALEHVLSDLPIDTLEFWDMGRERTDSMYRFKTGKTRVMLVSSKAIAGYNLKPYEERKVEVLFCDGCRMTEYEYAQAMHRVFGP